MKTVTIYKRAMSAVRDIQDWYYETFYTHLTPPQVLCYSLATVDLDSIKSVESVAKLIDLEETRTLNVTEIAHRKLVELRKSSGNGISMPLLTTLILLLKSLSLPDMETGKNIVKANKKRADVPPSEVMKRIGLQ